MINLEYLEKAANESYENFLEKVAAGGLKDYIPGISKQTAKDLEYNYINAWNNPLVMGGMGAIAGSGVAGMLGAGKNVRRLAGAVMVPLAYAAQTNLNKEYNPGYYGKKMSLV